MSTCVSKLSPLFLRHPSREYTLNTTETDSFPKSKVSNCWAKAQVKYFIQYSEKKNYHLPLLNSGILENKIKSKVINSSSFKPQFRNYSTKEFVDFSYVKSELGLNREEIARKLNIQLFQFNFCPFCVKVRKYLNLNKIKFNKVEVNMRSKIELNFTKYRKVPVALINNTQVLDSSLIISVIESHLISGQPIGEILTNYSINQNHDGENFSIDLPYKICDPLPVSDALRVYRDRESFWRELINKECYKLLHWNVFYTLCQSIEANKIIMSSVNVAPIYRVLYHLFGGLAMYTISHIRSRFMNFFEIRPYVDVRESLHDFCRRWMKDVGSREFHGGSHYNLADIEMYAAIMSLTPYPVYKSVLNNVSGIELWIDRMHRHEITTFSRNNR
ncbi:hypothetical protein MXB_5310 [Myxobolus squamalis]|nr:hypothetical protein MXB_5310 [Myxobolus squamalis]